MNIRFLGHSCFLITSGEYKLLFDPYLTGNPAAAVQAAEVEATHIFVSHGHGDHLGDAREIAARCNALVYATVETGNCLGEGITVDKGQIGGSVPAPFGRVKFTAAAHGSGVPGGLSCGFLFGLEGKKIYFAGDTGLIMDFALLEEENIDLAFLPIGDRFTMDPKDALRAIKMIRPRNVVPMHYNTWDAIKQDPEQFKRDVEGETNTGVTVLAPGDSMEL